MKRTAYQHFFVQEYPLCHAWMSDHRGKDTVVIFVHGLGGDAISTWQRFPSLVDDLQDQYPWWRKADLFFYGYRSEGQLPMLAHDLRRFVRRVFPKPDLRLEMYGAPFRRLSSDLCRLLPPTKYSTLQLVGHSMGGVIIRAMAKDLAVDASKAPSSITDAETCILNRADLRLFAPALFGTRVTGLAGHLLGRGWGDLLGRVLRPDEYQFIQDLEDCGELDGLKAESEALFLRNSNHVALTATSLWGKREQYLRVSIAGRYACDQPTQYAEGQDHVS